MIQKPTYLRPRYSRKGKNLSNLSHYHSTPAINHTFLSPGRLIPLPIYQGPKSWTFPKVMHAPSPWRSCLRFDSLDSVSTSSAAISPLGDSSGDAVRNARAQFRSVIREYFKAEVYNFGKDRRMINEQMISQRLHLIFVHGFSSYSWCQFSWFLPLM